MEISELEHLKKMANQIAANLSFARGEDQQIEDLAGHLQRFWAPSMKRRLAEYARADGAGLDAAVLGALRLVDPWAAEGVMPAGVILAGGRSRRLPPGPKAFLPLRGEAMIALVIRRLRPQVASLSISVTGDPAAYAEFGLPVVVDARPGHNGPLTGLYSAMSALQANGGADWLLACPCDAPLVPHDLATRLLRGAESSGCPVGVASYGDELQPTFSLWHKDVLPVLENAVMEQRLGGFKQVLPQLSHATVEWDRTEESPFMNINEPTDLSRAEAMLERQSGAGRS